MAAPKRGTFHIPLKAIREFVREEPGGWDGGGYIQVTTDDSVLSFFRRAADAMKIQPLQLAPGTSSRLIFNVPINLPGLDDEPSPSSGEGGASPRAPGEVGSPAAAALVKHAAAVQAAVSEGRDPRAVVTEVPRRATEDRPGANPTSPPAPLISGKSPRNERGDPPPARPPRRPWRTSRSLKKKP